jgi:hypothetical protein
MEVFDD